MPDRVPVIAYLGCYTARTGDSRFCAIVNAGAQRQVFGRQLPDTDRNTAIVLAAAHVAAALREPAALEIVTTNHYLASGISKLAAWADADWQAPRAFTCAPARRVANADQWQGLLAALAKTRSTLSIRLVSQADAPTPLRAAIADARTPMGLVLPFVPHPDRAAA